MATRFYFPSSGAADESPAFDGEWDLTAGASRFKCVTTKIGSAMAVRSPGSGSSTADHDWLCDQWVSDPITAAGAAALAAGGGTVKGQMRAAESHADLDGRAQIIIRVVSNDGTTFRGTLLAADTAALSSEFPAGGAGAVTNRQFPRGGSTALATVVGAVEDDRIVVEVGGRVHASIGSARSLRFSRGDDAAGDLAEDETTTTADNPWVEFSQDLFAAGGTDHFGSAALALTLSIATNGARVVFGAASLPLTLAVATSGVRTTFGTVALPVTFTAATVGRVGAFGSAALPLTLTIGTTGQVGAFGSTSLPLTLTAGSVGTVTAKGSASLPITLTVATNGARTTFGTASLPLTFAAATNGARTTFGTVAVPITFTAGSTGTLTAFSSADLPLTLTIGTNGTIEGQEDTTPRRLLLGMGT